MQERRGVAVTAAVAVVGGLLGAAFVWFSRPEPPTCASMDDGTRICLPIYVVGPSLWHYAAFALIGALLAGGATGYAWARRARRH